jgi:glycosyltransferase involved in cell wall biosynthesis
MRTPHVTADPTTTADGAAHARTVLKTVEPPRTPRRILMTADAVGGVWTYALELSAALEPYGIEVALAVMGPRPDASQRRRSAAVGNVTLFESDYRLEWMPEPWGDVDRAGRWLQWLARRLQPEVIHLNQFAPAALEWEAPVVVAAHSCVFSWFAAVRGRAPDAAWGRYRTAVARGLRAADRVTAPTAAMLRALRRHYGPFAAAAPIPNGRDPGRFRPAAAEPFILTAGRLWDEAKNLSMLMEAAARLPWPVYAAGDAEHPAGWRIGVHGVHPLGRLDESELAGWMGRAAVFALPARYEPFGLCALEAALSGCALVLGDIPSLREVWGDAAVFVPPDRPAPLERALRELIADPTRRASLAARCRRRAARYTLGRMAQGYLELYAGLLAREPAGRAASCEVRA